MPADNLRSPILARPEDANLSKPVRCDCGKSFITPAALRDHQRDSSKHKSPGLTEPSPATDLVTASTMPADNLRSPMLTRLEGKDSWMPVRCDCGKSFITPGALRDHQRDSPRHNPGLTESSPITALVTASTEAAATVYVLGLGMIPLSIENRTPDGTQYRRIEVSPTPAASSSTVAKGKGVKKQQSMQASKKQDTKKK
ncbi:hypothetical protein BU16DRAFT_247247 [Lophium mytilinum]|uniref:C2H2-type domain-containing protein n=1 Tax=Lophium mytilinum TaxID=390894 RepID=A0A6A6R9H3_9PEZI|nr:hypothetical protein BU16DRAFT_247247 [Lophium mytilinum]